MTLTNDERWLLALYYVGSAVETEAIVRDALCDITDPDERMAAVGLLRKLIGMGDAVFADTVDMGFAVFDLESEVVV